MSGTQPENHRISFECKVVNGEDPDLPGAAVITINPFVPSLYDADSFSPDGAFPTMTLMQLLGYDGFLEFERERHAGLNAVDELWPSTRMLFDYYLQGNVRMFVKTAKGRLGFDWEPSTSHERTTVAYHALGVTTTAVVGQTGSYAAQVIRRFASKHTAAMKEKRHLQVFRSRGREAENLERDVFTELNRFISQHESWEMGRLLRFVNEDARRRLGSLVLFRDEFAIVRDLYQQGFELACKCLWPLVAAQNTVKRRDPDDFGVDHPATVPDRQRAASLTQFQKLANAHKVAYVAQVPGWESFAAHLSSSSRNTIGHATAHHDLQTGRVVSDKDPVGITYLEFLTQTFGVFEALSTLAQVLRAIRVASSPDFAVPYE
jgi:hypothetical protein